MRGARGNPRPLYVAGNSAGDHIRKDGEEGGERVTSLQMVMLVALTRKLLIALWRLVTTGEMTEGLKLRPAGT